MVEVPAHCGMPMQILGFRLFCEGCGYSESHAPEKWHEKAQQIPSVEAAPKHCGIAMKLARTVSCSGCGYKTEQALPMGVG